MAEPDQPTADDDIRSPRTGGPVSSCLLCLFSIPLLDAPLGKPHDPVGLCKYCSSMSCGWHGARTSREFICILCDINNLFASAGWKRWEAEGGLDRLRKRLAPGTRGEPPTDAYENAAELAHALAALFSTADGDPSLAVVATLEQWFAERPHYDQFRRALDQTAVWAIGVINRWFQTRAMPGAAGQGIRGHYSQSAVRSLWEGLGDNGQRLLAAAVLLIVALDLPLETFPPPVVDVAQLLAGLLRDHPNRMNALQEQVRAQL